MKTYKQEAQFVSSGDILQFGEKGKEWREVVLDNIKVTSEDVSIETYVPSQIDMIRLIGYLIATLNLRW